MWCGDNAHLIGIGFFSVFWTNFEVITYVYVPKDFNIENQFPKTNTPIIAQNYVFMKTKHPHTSIRVNFWHRKLKSVIDPCN